MQSLHYSAPIVVITLAAVVTSFILGLLLRRYRGEFSTQAKIWVVILLAIATGITIFLSFSLGIALLASSWGFAPVLNAFVIAFIIAGVPSLFCGFLTLFCKVREEK